MTTAVSIAPGSAESLFDIGDGLARLLEQARQETAGGIPESVLARLMDMVEALRSRLIPKVQRDPRSLFDLDERLIELIDCAEEAAEAGEVPQELLQEIS